MPTESERPQLVQGHVNIKERNHAFQRDIFSDHHHLIADEPVDHQGTDLGFDPYELLMASLGACTSMTVRMYANQKGWPLEDVDVLVHHEKKHEADADGGKRTVDHITRTVTLTGPLSEEQRQRLLDIANKCPVYRTLTGQLRITSALGHEAVV